ECGRLIAEAVAHNTWEEVGVLAHTPPTKHRTVTAYKVSEGAVRLYGTSYRAVVVHSSTPGQTAAAAAGEGPGGLGERRPDRHTAGRAAGVFLPCGCGNRGGDTPRSTHCLPSPRGGRGGTPAVWAGPAQGPSAAPDQSSALQAEYYYTS